MYCKQLFARLRARQVGNASSAGREVSLQSKDELSLKESFFTKLGSSYSNLVGEGCADRYAKSDQLEDEGEKVKELE